VIKIILIPTFYNELAVILGYEWYFVERIVKQK